MMMSSTTNPMTNPTQSGSLGFPRMTSSSPIMAPGVMPTNPGIVPPAVAPAAGPPRPAPAPGPGPMQNVPASVIGAPPTATPPAAAPPVAAQPAAAPPGHGMGNEIPHRFDRLGLGDMMRQYLAGGGDMRSARDGLHDIRKGWRGGHFGDNPLQSGGSGLLTLLAQKLGIAIPSAATPPIGAAALAPQPATAVPTAFPLNGG